MAHEIENMFYVGETPWHGLGVPLNAPPTIEEAIDLAGLNWSVNVEPVYLSTGEESKKARAVVRDYDKAELGIVGTSYTPLQNQDAFSWFQPFVDSGSVELHTAGSLRGGERVWILANVKGGSKEIVKGDEVQSFMLLSNGHDGKLSARVGFTPIRVVCANTMSMAHGSESSKLIRVKHTSQVKENLLDIRETMDTINRSFEMTYEQLRHLASRGCNENDLKKFVQVVFKTKHDIEDEESSSKVYDEVVELFIAGKGSDIKGVRGTWWGAYNAVTEHLSWTRGDNKDTRINNLWFQSGSRINKIALDTALQLAA